MTDEIIYVSKEQMTYYIPYVPPMLKDKNKYIVPGDIRHIEVKRDSSGQFPEVTMPDGTTVKVVIEG